LATELNFYEKHQRYTESFDMAVSLEVEQPPTPAKSNILNLRDLGVALAISNLTFLRVWWELLTYTKADLFFMKSPPSRTELVAVMLNVIVLTFILTAATALVRKYCTARIAQIAVDIAIALVFIFPALSLLIALSGRYPKLRELPFRFVGQKISLIIGVTAFVFIAYVLLHKRKINGAIILLPFVPLTFGQAIWKSIRYDPSSLAEKPPAPYLPIASDSPRLVWIIFDRLDQRLTFMDRPQQIQLPEFDRMRREAVYARNAFPPSAYTIFSMPSLTQGRQDDLVGDAKPLDEKTLEIRYLSKRKSVWGLESTVFSEARAIGMNSGVVGWYLPYCRVFPQVLSSCEWFEMSRQHNSYDMTLDRTEPLSSVMQNEVRSLAETNFLSPFGQSLTTRKHSRTYDALTAAAREMTVDPKLNLVLLHLPIPHWPYFYNRRTGTYDLRNSLVYGYLDGLVLADLTLGLIRRDLEAAGMWDRTTVLVSSDHSHRSAPRNLDGKTNPRVPFLLKLAGQKTGVEFPSDFNTVLTKELLLAILKSEVSTPRQAIEWLARHKSLAQSPYDRDL